jgi:hypothetical protein
VIWSIGCPNTSSSSVFIRNWHMLISCRLFRHERHPKFYHQNRKCNVWNPLSLCVFMLNFVWNVQLWRYSISMIRLIYRTAIILNNPIWSKNQRIEWTWTPWELEVGSGAQGE